MLLFEIAGGVVLGLILFQKYKEIQKEAEVSEFLDRNSPANTPLCGICGHPSAYHGREDASGKLHCSNCAWYEDHGHEHGWTESRPYSGTEGFMKAGDYVAHHYFQREKAV